MSKKLCGLQGVNVQRCGPEDFDLALHTMRTLKFLHSPPSVYGNHLRQFLANPKDILIIATRGQVPIGYLVAYLLDRVDRSQCMTCLYEVEVAESLRRRGVGRAMIQKLKAMCKTEKVMKTWVITNRSNSAAFKLYESTGAVAESNGDNVVFVYPSED